MRGCARVRASAQVGEAGCRPGLVRVGGPGRGAGGAGVIGGWVGEDLGLRGAPSVRGVPPKAPKILPYYLYPSLTVATVASREKALKTLGIKWQRSVATLAARQRCRPRACVPGRALCTRGTSR